jgi:acetyl esterase/lipase
MRFRRTGFLAVSLIPLGLLLPFCAAAQQAAPERPFIPAAAAPSPAAPPAAAAGVPTVRGIEPVNSYGPQKISYSNGVTGVFDLTYATLPGFRPLTLDLYSPRAGSGALPLVVFVHGGGWNGGDARHTGTFEDFPATLAALAARGYVVASVNYRLSEEARFPAALQDVKAAIRWLRGDAAGRGIDATRVAVWGAAAGGQLAALTGVTCGVDRFEPAADAGVKNLPSDCAEAVIDWYGVTDLESLADDSGTETPSRSSFTAQSSTAEGDYLGCEPADCAPGLARLASPLAFISNLSPAFLIQHGAADTTVPPRQSQKLYDALRAKGIPAELVLYPGVAHDFTRAGNPDPVLNDQAMAKLTAFLATSFPPPPVAANKTPAMRSDLLN